MARTTLTLSVEIRPWVKHSRLVGMLAMWVGLKLGAPLGWFMECRA